MKSIQTIVIVLLVVCVVLAVMSLPGSTSESYDTPRDQSRWIWCLEQEQATLPGENESHKPQRCDQWAPCDAGCRYNYCVKHNKSKDCGKWSGCDKKCQEYAPPVVICKNVWGNVTDNCQYGNGCLENCYNE